MFFPSPRNSIVAQKELIARTKCRILLTPDPEPPLVTGFVRENTTSTIQIPSLKELFKHDDTIIPYVYVYEQKPLDVIRDQPVLILHTSGSTGRHFARMVVLHKLLLKSGIPKPIIYTHEFFWRIVRANTLPAPEGTMRINDLILRGEFFSLLPAFHVSGLLGRILRSGVDSLNRLQALGGASFSHYSKTASPCFLCPADRRRLLAS
jgi:acyl-CoA synthetase (AMP-forming)/AMP-acid ligase II